jgi:hypothetical protein
MTLDAIRQMLLGGGGILFVLLTIIQIAPIKIDPWTWIGRHIGRMFNGEVLDRMDKLDKKVDNVDKELGDHKEKSEERHATLCRAHILRFGDEVLHGVPHSKEGYDNILLDIDNYEEYCDKHPGYKNNIAVATIKNIKRMYQKHLEDDSFL